jgi:two-component system response regulator
MPTKRPILLVEDNPDDEALALRAFAKAEIDHPVVVARDGQEALDYLFATGAHSTRNPARTPAVILLDLKLPRLDGREVLRRIRADEHTRHVPVVVLSTSRQPEDIHEAHALGANSYVRKPVDFERFLAALGQLAQYWLNINETAD